MQGILIVDKPTDFTSFDVVAKLRGICQTRKIGHSGTLDPMATGVLPVFIGNAAKAVDMMAQHDKIYEATMRLGLCTDTGDITGETLQTAAVPSGIDVQTVREAVGQFIGEGMQVPPMYSAVKINGVPLYKAARKGQTVERTPRPIVVHSIEVTGHPTETDYTLQIHCGKGTYVRVLLEEIGKALGTVATMAALRRTMASGYTLAHAHTFAEIQAAKDAGTLEQLLQSVETVFLNLPQLSVNEATYKRLLNGATTYRFPAENGRYRVKYEENFLGVCTVCDGELCAEKLFIER